MPTTESQETWVSVSDRYSPDEMEFANIDEFREMLASYGLNPYLRQRGTSDEWWEFVPPSWYADDDDEDDDDAVLSDDDFYDCIARGVGNWVLLLQKQTGENPK